MPQQGAVSKDLSVISNMGGAIAVSMPPRNKLEKSDDKRRAVAYEYRMRQLKSCLGQLEQIIPTYWLEQREVKQASQ